ncbi:MAG TPA: hypothetical protein VKG92_01145, partial [Flavobacteriales bacterium]|nr:hypothetical protein [Flavobacteriales bacterium]
DTYSRAMRHFTARPWHGPLLLIRSAEGGHEGRGWEAYSSDLRTVVVPGDHLSIVGAKDVGPVARAIADALTTRRL